MNKRPLRTALAASAFAALSLAAAACSADPLAAPTADKSAPAPTTGTPQPIHRPRDPALDAGLLRAARATTPRRYESWSPAGPTSRAEAIMIAPR
ncbi:hypothetical protein [Nocardia sp. CA-119907]|uniref:hypothetical protein n=1 Tax=Nocardia sp. CA-119907 TaxID=3239973 RepID=UPI003D973637